MMALLVAESAAIKIQSDPICNSAGCTQYLHPTTEDWDKNYFVPNFGADTEMIAAKKSLEIAEKQLKHKLVIPEVPDKEKVKYTIGGAYDSDIISTQKHIADTEKQLDHKLTIKTDE